MNEALEKLAATLEASWNKTDAARLADYKAKVRTDDNGQTRYEYMCGLTRHERDVCLFGDYQVINSAEAWNYVCCLDERLSAKVGEILDITAITSNTYIARGTKKSAMLTQVLEGGYGLIRLQVRNTIKAL